MIHQYQNRKIIKNDKTHLKNLPKLIDLVLAWEQRLPGQQHHHHQEKMIIEFILTLISVAKLDILVLIITMTIYLPWPC